MLGLVRDRKAQRRRPACLAGRCLQALSFGSKRFAGPGTCFIIANDSYEAHNGSGSCGNNRLISALSTEVTRTGVSQNRLARFWHALDPECLVDCHVAEYVHPHRNLKSMQTPYYTAAVLFCR